MAGRFVIACLAVVLGIAGSACDRSADRDGASLTLSGDVTRGPMCPVERADSPCPDEPADVTLVFERAGDVVEQVRTGADGTYEVALPPGRYDVRVGGAETGIGSAIEPASVVVDADGAEQDFSIDTGIR